MAAVTNAPFRLVARECGAGRLTSEELDALRRALRQREDVGPRALLSGGAADLAAAARQRSGRPRGGRAAARSDGRRRHRSQHGLSRCTKIVNKGHGAALMRDPLTAGVVFRTMRKAVRARLHDQDPRRLGRAHDQRAGDRAHRGERGRGRDHRAPAHARAAVHGPRAVGCDRRASSTRWRSPSSATATCASLAGRRGDARRSTGLRGRDDRARRARAGRGSSAAPSARRDERARIIRRHCELIEAHLPPQIALIQLKKHLAWYAAERPRHGAAAAAAVRGARVGRGDSDAVLERVVSEHRWFEDFKVGDTLREPVARRSTTRTSCSSRADR